MRRLLVNSVTAFLASAAAPVSAVTLVCTIPAEMQDGQALAALEQTLEVTEARGWVVSEDYYSHESVVDGNAVTITISRYTGAYEGRGLGEPVRGTCKAVTARDRKF